MRSVEAAAAAAAAQRTGRGCLRAAPPALPAGSEQAPWQLPRPAACPPRSPGRRLASGRATGLAAVGLASPAPAVGLAAPSPLVGPCPWRRHGDKIRNFDINKY